MNLLALDPGTTETGYVIIEFGKLKKFGKLNNNDILDLIFNYPLTHLAIEKIAFYGVMAGASTFETCFWSGRFYEAWESQLKKQAIMVYRKDVKMELCGTTYMIKDKDVRKAIIKLFGGEASALGLKDKPGPLWNMANDAWQALAVGIYAYRLILGKLRSSDMQLRLDIKQPKER